MADNKEEEASPHEAIFFALTYLPLFQLITMTRVCKSLRDSINNDILPWLKIVVDRPLSSRLSDDILMEVASRAKGRLQVLALINCVRITDDGLLRVIQQNPNISKLHVPGCTNLSPEGIITAVKLINKHNHTLKSLRISGIYGIQNEHLDSLHGLLNHDQTNQKNIFYHESLSSLYDCSIDVDICPKCKEITMVFDCPQQNPECRGCRWCITRCAECGVCINDTQELEDASCQDTLCSVCWLKLPKCNHCNKPYCRQHADQQIKIPGSVGFLCASCYFLL